MRKLMAAFCVLAGLSVGMWADAKQMSSSTAQRETKMYLYTLVAAQPEMMAQLVCKVFRVLLVQMEPTVRMALLEQQA